jgi:plastocyanin
MRSRHAMGRATGRRQSATRTATETASSETQATPTWTLDTSNRERGYHTYYCVHHRWMRGPFYVQ